MRASSGELELGTRRGRGRFFLYSSRALFPRRATGSRRRRAPRRSARRGGAPSCARSSVRACSVARAPSPGRASGASRGGARGGAVGSSRAARTRRGRRGPSARRRSDGSSRASRRRERGEAASFGRDARSGRASLGRDARARGRARRGVRAACRAVCARAPRQFPRLVSEHATRRGRERGVYSRWADPSETLATRWQGIHPSAFGCTRESRRVVNPRFFYPEPRQLSMLAQSEKNARGDAS